MYKGYISKKKAFDELDYAYMHCADIDCYGLSTALDVIDEIESADVVQVVRCRKCKYFWTYQCMDSMPIETCELAQTFYNPDLDFCSLAKRREE